MPSVMVGRMQVHVERAGQGPAMVLLHDINGSASSWQHQLQGLAADCDVLAWDMPGYGGSDDAYGPYTVADLAGAVAGLLDQVGIDQVHVCGQGLGGLVALELWRLAPARPLSLILTGTAAAPSATPAGSGLPPALLAPDATPEVTAEVEAILAAIRPDGYVRAGQALAQADARDVLDAVRTPALVLFGEHDQVCSREAAEELAASIAGAHFEVVPDAGHQCQQENPSFFNAAVRRFLAGLP